MIAKAFGDKRDKIVIATKVGYDFVHHGDERRGQREIPQNFRPEAIRAATDAALKRLSTDHIDLLQLHNIRMDQVDDDDLWATLEDLRQEGKVRQYGVALGPAIGWLGEGVRTIRKRNPAVVQHIYNLLEQHPGKAIHNSARESGSATMFLIRVPHSSGMLEGKYTPDTVFPPNDHRNHRPRSWLLNGVKKVEQLRFLERGGLRTLGQAAILWLLADDRVCFRASEYLRLRATSRVCRVPRISPRCPSEEMERVAALVAGNFGLESEEPKFKGTMELKEELATA